MARDRTRRCEHIRISAIVLAPHPLRRLLCIRFDDQVTTQVEGRVIDPALYVEHFIASGERARRLASDRL